MSRREVSETAEMLANMTVGSGRNVMRQSLPAPMKAGGWHSQSDSFLGRSQELRSGRAAAAAAYGRKVAG